MATQNPIESEGTYPLPEAQVDRFMMKVVVGYPTAARGADRRGALAPAGRPRSAASSTADSLAELQAATPDDLRRPAIVDVRRRDRRPATREPEPVGLSKVKPYIAYGASPRGSINLIHAARALALVRGRRYVIPTDVTELAPTSCATASCPVLHRPRGGGHRRHDPRPHPARPSPRRGIERTEERTA